MKIGWKRDKMDKNYEKEFYKYLINHSYRSLGDIVNSLNGKVLDEVRADIISDIEYILNTTKRSGSYLDALEWLNVAGHKQYFLMLNDLIKKINDGSGSMHSTEIPVQQNIEELDSYVDPGGQDQELGIFVITAFNVAHETDYENVDMIHANGLNREYSRRFLQDVIMQGTGIDSDGNYLTIDWSQGRPSDAANTNFVYVDGVRGASGRILEDGISIAVDPSVIPLGTWVNIEGFGLRRADDTGGEILGNHIDVFMDVPRIEALEFGVQNRNVTIP
jgi:3D (Asp-Asp-Asp) domain-containing protein